MLPYRHPISWVTVHLYQPRQKCLCTTSVESAFKPLRAYGRYLSVQQVCSSLLGLEQLSVTDVRATDATLWSVRFGGLPERPVFPALLLWFSWSGQSLDADRRQRAAGLPAFRSYWPKVDDLGLGVVPRRVYWTGSEWAAVYPLDSTTTDLYLSLFP